jgi:GTPase
LDGLSEDPLADFSQINSELAMFDPALTKKPMVVALNKMDIPEVSERWPVIKAELEKKGYQPMAISALTGDNVRPMLWKASELLSSAPEPEKSTALPVYRPTEDPRAFVIAREGNNWRITGAAIERAAAMTYFEHPGSLRRFQRLLEKVGAEKALREAGIETGESVLIGDFELEWQD